MHRRMSMFDRLKKSKRIDLTPKNYRKRVTSFYLILWSIVFSGIATTLLLAGISYLSIGIAIGLLLVTALIIRYFNSRLSETSIKGDTLILKSMKERATVTSIRSVGHIRSKRMLGVEWTSFRYTLDGKKRTTLIINRCSYLPCSASDFLKKAIELSKEKKANHKLGSVSAS